MSHQFANTMADDPSPSKKRKVSQLQVASMIMQCRSVRIGTLRRMVTKPVIVRLIFYFTLLLNVFFLQKNDYHYLTSNLYPEPDYYLCWE